MWNPFKRTQSEDNVHQPYPPEQSLDAAPSPRGDVQAVEPKPQYQVWSEAIQDAGVRGNKPCTPAQIEAFERELGVELTPELRQLYLMHDGMAWSDRGNYRLLSLQEVREMGGHAHSKSAWFPSLANDDWKLRTFFTYDNSDNTNAAVYLKGPLRGCVAEWGGGFPIDLPTFRSVNQLLFRATNAIIEDIEISQYEPPWSDYPAGPSPSPQALSHDRQLVAALRELLDAVPPDAYENIRGSDPTNRGYLESCIINVTPVEDVSQLRPFLDSDDSYVLENMTAALKHRRLDEWICDKDELRSWMKRLSEVATGRYGNAKSNAIEVLGSIRSTDVRRYVRFVLVFSDPAYLAGHWVKRDLQRHAEFRMLDDKRQEYRIVGTSEWHPVGSKYGEPGEP